MRIGELSRRTGVGTDALRAWERRYGVLRPERSPGGFRLYSASDEQRVRTMTRLIADGFSAAEAARSALAEDSGPLAPGADGGDAEALCEALVALDEETATAIVDRAVAALSVDALVRELMLPAMHEIGERWRRGEIGVAEEHFASNLLRARMLGLARGWGSGGSPIAILACPPGELHDLGLIAFGLALRARGWRIAYLGQDTPIETIEDLAGRLGNPAIVLAAADADRYRGAEPALKRLATTPGRLSLGGAGSDPELARGLGANDLGSDPVAAASALSAAP
jgi:MerR family transcriptional regulator, light-induced transcriptional regulator